MFEEYSDNKDIARIVAKTYKEKYKEDNKVIIDIVCYIQMVTYNIKFMEEDLTDFNSKAKEYFNKEDYTFIHEVLLHRIKRSAEKEQTLTLSVSGLELLKATITKIELYRSLVCPIERISLMDYLFYNLSIPYICDLNPNNTIDYISYKYFENICSNNLDEEYLTIISNIMFAYGPDKLSKYSNFLSNPKDLMRIYNEVIPSEYYDENFIDKMIKNGLKKYSDTCLDKIHEFYSRSMIIDYISPLNGTLTGLKTYTFTLHLSGVLFDILKYTLKSNKDISKFAINILTKMRYLNPSLNSGYRSEVDSIFKYLKLGTQDKVSIVDIARSKSF